MKRSDGLFYPWEIVKSRLITHLKENVLFKPNCSTVKLELVHENQLVLNKRLERVDKKDFPRLKWLKRVKEEHCNT